ncbi:MAG: DinB family protein [Candidatus Promineofilum sp.]|nr:DinB family protein [Promineifilum sp.]
MDDALRPPEEILARLAEGPLRLAQLTAGLSPGQLTAPPAPGEWSARDVLGHLRACADMWGRYIALILSEDRPTFKAVNPRTWIRQTDYLELAFRPSLAAFTAQRADLLAVLTPLPAGGWSRSATVTGAGKPRERTVYAYAEWLASHERSHVRQIGRLAAAAERR